MTIFEWEVGAEEGLTDLNLRMVVVVFIFHSKWPLHMQVWKLRVESLLHWLCLPSLVDQPLVDNGNLSLTVRCMWQAPCWRNYEGKPAQSSLCYLIHVINGDLKYCWFSIQIITVKTSSVCRVQTSIWHAQMCGCLYKLQFSWVVCIKERLW